MFVYSKFILICHIYLVVWIVYSSLQVVIKNENYLRLKLIHLMIVPFLFCTFLQKVVEQFLIAFSIFRVFFLLYLLPPKTCAHSILASSKDGFKPLFMTQTNKYYFWLKNFYFNPIFQWIFLCDYLQQTHWLATYDGQVKMIQILIFIIDIMWLHGSIKM